MNTKTFNYSLFYYFLFVPVLLLTTCNDNPVNGGKPPCPPIGIDPMPAHDSPVWHPSGDYIGFNHIPLMKIEYPFGEHCQGRLYFDYSQAGFWLVNPDGTNKRRIFPYTIQSPAWSPDGEWIAFSSPVGGESHIFKMKFTGETFDTTTVTQLTFEGRNFFPAWSPDGEWIAYDSNVNDPRGANVIWKMFADGSNRQDISIHGVGEWRMPNWSPGGAKIVHQRYIGIGAPEIVTMDTSGNNELRLTYDDRFNSHPRYSPDESFISFASQKPGDKPKLWIIHVDKLSVRLLIDDSVDSTFGLPFSWSPDGKYIAYTRYDAGNWSYDNGDLWLLNVDTGERKQLTSNPSQ